MMLMRRRSTREMARVVVDGVVRSVSTSQRACVSAALRHINDGADDAPSKIGRASFLRSPWIIDGGRRREYASSSGPDDYYALLGVKPGCTDEELKKAYRREALRWHPDRHQGAEKATAEARFKKISAAYQELSKPGGRSTAYGASTSGQGSGGGRSSAYANSGGYRPPPGAGQYRYEYRQDFTREDAERVFKEMFGNDSSSFIRELERAMRQAHMRGGMPGGFGAAGFGPGGFAFGRGMSAVDLNDLFKSLFQDQMRGAGGFGGANEIRETSYVNSRGETVIRRVIRSRGPNGVVSESVTERVVGRGGAAAGEGMNFDPWRQAYQQATSGGSSGGARKPPPPGSVVSVNPLVELAVGAARVVRIAFMRFVAAYGARILQNIIRFVLRRLFGGR